METAEIAVRVVMMPLPRPLKQKREYEFRKSDW